MSDSQKLMDAVKCRCSAGTWTLRVEGGDLRTAGWSVYACPDCAPLRAEIIRREYPDVAVHPLPDRSES